MTTPSQAPLTVESDETPVPVTAPAAPETPAPAPTTALLISQIQTAIQTASRIRQARPSEFVKAAHNRLNDALKHAQTITN